MGRRISAALAFAAAFTVVASCTSAPDPIAAGLAGSDGPCGAARRAVPNPAQPDLPVNISEPTGSGAPFTGGSCSDASRPVILLGHGIGASSPTVYAALVTHLVGQGFVVIEPGYAGGFDQPQQYRAENEGFVAGVAASPRVDVSRLGFVGHSWGAGMVPAMMQAAAARGWGTAATWAVQMAPAWEFGVGTGPIALPSNARVLVVNYADDATVDMAIGSEALAAMDVPESHKQHLLIHGDGSVAPGLRADHFLPSTVVGTPGSPFRLDHFDRWAAWRPIEAWARCALDGTWCDTDLADMGTHPDGSAVTRASIGLDLDDVGPPATAECASVLNPRRCPA